MREPASAPARDIAAMTAGFAEGPEDASAVVAKLIEGLDLNRRDFAANEFVDLPPAAFVARAYAACLGHAPAAAVFRSLQDRLVQGAVSRTGLLRELAASARGVHISGLGAEAAREAWQESLPAALVLKTARAGRIIVRLPRNLRRKWAAKPAPFVPAAPFVQTAPQSGPKIAILSVTASEMGGAERFYAGLRDALNQAGMNAELVALESEERDFTRTVKSYRRFYDLDLSAYDGVISAKAPTYAARHPNHVCYLMHTMRSWYDMFGASHPFASPGTRDARRQIQALDTAALQSVKKRFAIGEEVAERLRAYNGLDAQLLHLPSTLTGLHEGPFEHLFMPGRLHPWKRVELAIAAMRFVKSPVKLVIAGTGQEEARLRAMARHDPRIVFTGWISEAQLADYYSRSAVALLLPKREDLGLVIFEAFGCGKPVITCTDSGEPARLIRDGQSGFVCAPEPAAIAERIEQLLRDPARAAAMGASGRASVADTSWNHVAATLIAALGLKVVSPVRS